jgi:hypothetical protein
MKVNKSLFKAIRIWRDIQFYFWLTFYYAIHLPEIIYLYVFIEILYMKLMIISLINFLFGDE